MPSTSKNDVVLRVFVSSPDDIREAREIVSATVQDINRVHAATDGFRLDVVRWDRDVYPDIDSEPQAVINKQVSAPDIFLGVLSTKFGTPTRAAGSGTEEEFERAFEKYLIDPRSIIIAFYFHNAQVKTLESDAHQLYQIQNFRKSLSSRGVLWSRFDTLHDFQRMIRDHLVLQARDLIARRRIRPGRPKKRPRPESLIKVPDWHPVTRKTTPQWANFIEIPVYEYRKRGISLTGIIQSSSPYFRFGFKLMSSSGNLFGDGTIQTSDNNFVIHLGRNKDDPHLFLTVYRNGIRLGENKNLVDYSKQPYVPIRLTIDKNNFIDFAARDECVFEGYLPPGNRDRLSCLAWGDHDEYEIHFERVILEVT